MGHVTYERHLSLFQDHLWVAMTTSTLVMTMKSFTWLQVILGVSATNKQTVKPLARVTKGANG